MQLPLLRRRWVTRTIGGAILSLVAFKMFVDWPVIFSDEVPPQIQRAANDRYESIGASRVYGCWQNVVELIDPQYLWRIEMAPDLVPDLVRICEVTELRSADEIPDAFWKQRPYWWHPRRTSSTQYFKSPSFQPDGIGPDGSSYVMAYDGMAHVLYVWHKVSYY